MTESTVSDAYFAGRIFVLYEQNGIQFLMWGTHSIPFDGKGQLALSTTVAEPVAGAFLAPHENGWLLVAGRGKYSAVRHTFFDESPEAAANAESVQALGVPVISVEEGQERVREDGGIVLSITGDEKRQAEAAARYEGGRKKEMN